VGGLKPREVLALERSALPQLELTHRDSRLRGNLCDLLSTVALRLCYDAAVAAVALLQKLDDNLNRRLLARLRRAIEVVLAHPATKLERVRVQDDVRRLGRDGGVVPKDASSTLRGFNVLERRADADL